MDRAGDAPSDGLPLTRSGPVRRIPTALAAFAEAVADDPMSAASLAGFVAGFRARTLDDRVKVACVVSMTPTKGRAP